NSSKTGRRSGRRRELIRVAPERRWAGHRRVCTDRRGERSLPSVPGDFPVTREPDRGPPGRPAGKPGRSPNVASVTISNTRCKFGRSALQGVAGKVLAELESGIRKEKANERRADP